MDDEWKYGDVLRRAVTMNPTQYTRVMYLRPSSRLGYLYFVGIQLTEAPEPAAGEWISPPTVGAIRPRLRRRLFEKDPDAD